MDEERWTEARALLRRRLQADAANHWLLTRLSLTYYEERRYSLALKYAEQAFDQVPSCPLVLWDYAGALQMLGRHSEALHLYAQLVTRGVDRLATGDCGEGRAWARGLVADAHYRASLSLEALGNPDASNSAFELCLDMRGPGCRSIYRLSELVSAFSTLRHGKPQSLTNRIRPKAKSQRSSRPGRG